MAPRLVEARAVEDHLGPHPLHCGHLAWIGAFGHDDARGHAEQPRRIRHRLPVVARGRGDDPGRAFGRAQLCHQVDAPAHLERADRLVVFVLDVNRRADERIERRVVVHRSARQVRPQAPLRRQDVQQGRNGHGRCSPEIRDQRPGAWKADDLRSPISDLQSPIFLFNRCCRRLQPPA